MRAVFEHRKQKVAQLYSLTTFFLNIEVLRVEKFELDLDEERNEGYKRSWLLKFFDSVFEHDVAVNIAARVSQLHTRLG